MQVSVETTEGLERRMTVQVPAERIDEEVDKRLRSMLPNISIKGFRPGKVPMRVVKSRYSAQVRDEVLGEMVRTSFYEAATQESLDVVGGPRVEPKNDKPGEDFEYIATFEVYPQFELASIEDLKIERPKVEITEADKDAMIEKLRSRHTTWEEVERESRDGDQMVIDYVGTIDGEVFPGGEGKEIRLVLGEGRMIDGFEENLSGLKAGDEKEFTVTFPDDYHAKDVAGKEATFKVTVGSVLEPRLPEVDAEFAKRYGIEDGDLDKLREEVASNMQRELDLAVKRRIKEQVMDGLLEANQFDLPKVMVQGEIERLRNQALEQVKAAGVPAPEMKDEEFEDEARRRVRLGLLVRKIVDDNGLKVSQDKVNATLEGIASSYDHPQEVIDYYRANHQLMSDVEALVLEEQVVEWVAERASVTEVEQDFESFMNPQQG
jgi:trigger factor